MTYPLVGLGLVDVVDVDEHDLEASDISETIPNRFLLKSWTKKHVPDFCLIMINMQKNPTISLN